MIYILDNIGAILAATAVGILSALVLARMAKGLSPTPVRALAALLALFWLAAILAGGLILAPPEVRSQAGAWTIALGTAAIIWAGFVLPVCAATLPVLGCSWRRTFGVAGIWLAVMLAMAGVLQLVGLDAPAAAPSAMPG